MERLKIILLIKIRRCNLENIIKLIAMFIISTIIIYLVIKTYIEFDIRSFFVGVITCFVAFMIWID